jgi:acetylglutamate kinase
MKALIKIGGTLLDRAESRLQLAGEIARAVEGGLQAVVVHGGGVQVTRFLAERGVESRFVDGLRVTTPEVLDAVLKVLAGSVNQELVGAMAKRGPTKERGAWSRG